MPTETHSDLPLGRHLAILTKMYYGALTKRLEHLEIDRDYSVLIYIYKHAKKCTQKQVADILKIDKASMVGIIDNLVKKDYVKRIQNPEDRREYWLSLTPRAIKIMPEIQQEIKLLNAIALNGLSEAEVKIFGKALCTISANLNELPADRVVINYKKIKSNEKL